MHELSTALCGQNFRRAFLELLWSPARDTPAWYTFMHEVLQAAFVGRVSSRQKHAPNGSEIAKSRNRIEALPTKRAQPTEFLEKKKRKKQRALPLLRWVPLVQVCAAKKARQRALLPKPADPCATNEGKNTAAAVGDGWSALQIKSTLSLIRAHNPPVNHTGGFSGLEDFLDFEIFWTNGTQQRTATCSV